MTSVNATQRLQQVLAKHEVLLTHGGQHALRAVGFSALKRSLLKRYLQSLGLGAYQLHTQADAPCATIVWGATQADNCCAHVEDGFIRSVGLGADLTRPLSWVFDTRGIYFDASRPSDLEWLLQNKDFEPSEIDRAVALRTSLIHAGITKYNVGDSVWCRPAHAKRVVLVAGQVETDASIRLGSHVVTTNAQLLKACREHCPSDYLVYKPHPDVAAGLRAGDVPLKKALQWCDEVVMDADMALLLGQVDAVHVITSLTGFEALMRGLDVTCYGTPFYAGWGLCSAPHLLPAAQARRGRGLSIDQLVCAALIDYPSYMHPTTDTLITAEQAIEFLRSQRHDHVTTGVAAFVQKLKRWVLSWTAKLQNRF